MEHSGRAGRKSFKIPLSAINLFPEDVAEMFKSLRRTVIVFEGRKAKVDYIL